MKKILSVFIGLLCALTVMADDATLTKIAQLNKAHTSIQYAFNETDFKKLKGTSTKRRGTLYFTGKKMSMLYSAPAGDKKVIADNAYSQVRDGKAMKMSIAGKNPIASLSHMLLNSMAGNVKAILTENGAVEKTTTVGNQYVVTIQKSKGVMGTLKSLVLKYNKTTGVLEYMKMEQSTGDYNEYVISGAPVLNKTIANDKFTHAK